jgi:hypothetical protein
VVVGAVPLNPRFQYQENTLRDALVASVHLDAFHRHAERVVMANIAQTVNVLQAMLLTDLDTGALVLTPTCHVVAVNTGHHDAVAIAVHLRDVVTRAVAAASSPSPAHRRHCARTSTSGVPPIRRRSRTHTTAATGRGVGDTVQTQYDLAHFTGYRFASSTTPLPSPGGYVDVDWFPVSDTTGLASRPHRQSEGAVHD